MCDTIPAGACSDSLIIPISPLPAETSADDVVEALSERLIEYGNRVRVLITDLPDETLLKAADCLETQAGCVGFRIEPFDDIADTLRTEVGYRRHLKQARDAGGGMYCMTCEGPCESEEKHEQNAARKWPPVPPAELEIRSWHRNRLVKELLDAKRQLADYEKTQQALVGVALSYQQAVQGSFIDDEEMSEAQWDLLSPLEKALVVLPVLRLRYGWSKVKETP